MDHFLKPIWSRSELYLNFRLKTPRKTGPLSGSPTGWLTLFNYCDGAMVAVGYLETLLKVEGWWEKMSSRPRPAAVAGDVLCCLVLSFWDYDGSLLSSWWSTLLCCPWFLQHTGCSSLVTLSLSWPANQKLLSQKHDVSHLVDLILSLNNLCFIQWMQRDLGHSNSKIEIYRIFCKQ